MIFATALPDSFRDFPPAAQISPAADGLMAYFLADEGRRYAFSPCITPVAVRCFRGQMLPPPADISMPPPRLRMPLFFRLALSDYFAARVC